MDQMIADSTETYDLCFIDADKKEYSQYLDRAHALMRTGGLVIVDNVLWYGRVLDVDSAPNNTKDTNAIIAFNDALKDDDRWDTSMLAIGDGITLCRKK